MLLNSPEFFYYFTFINKNNRKRNIINNFAIKLIIIKKQPD